MIKSLNFFTNNYYYTINKILTFTIIIYSYYFFLTFTTVSVINLNSYLYLSAIVISAIGLFLEKSKIFKFNHFKIIAFSYIVFTLLINCYFSCVYNNSIHVDYFFFSIVTTIPIVYNTAVDYILCLIILVLIFFCLVFINSFHLFFNFPNVFYSESKLSVLKYSNIIFSSLIVFFNLIYYKQREMFFIKIKKQNLSFKKRIKNYNNQLKKNDFKDLIEEAKVNFVLFLEKIDVYYPNLMLKFKKDKNFKTMDLYTIALVKLGLNTKEIATVSNSSIKAIENRKYRIKKKLGLKKHSSIYDYIKNF